MIIEYEGKTYNVRTEKIEKDSYDVIINDVKSDFSVIPITENIFKIKQNNKNQIAYVTSNDEKYYFCCAGDLYEISKSIESDVGYDVSENSLNKLIIKPPMPGSIVKVEVSVGQEINEGEPILIIEAMKMETTLFSSISGVVTEVNVQPGEQVPADKILAIIEKSAE